MYKNATYPMLRLIAKVHQCINMYTSQSRFDYKECIVGSRMLIIHLTLEYLTFIIPKLQTELFHIF